MGQIEGMMLGQTVIIIGLGSIVISLFFTEKRNPGEIAAHAAIRFIVILVTILIVKAVWLLAITPWTGG